ncbi:MAG: hypothetical protein QGF59_19305 [Pirellulaceae bacterium]|nr:hypothetical protein [Pirellulaceae bacterium]MDP6720821.1 hypothetical protein [Pirellulaceae bacterium]
MLNDQKSILVGQAVFTSSRGSGGRGYHLVARSPEICEPLARHLSRWGPAHGSLLTDDRDGSSFNYTPIDNEWVTVSRTLYGGPEYSRRGTLQVVTVILALRYEQLSGYDNNPLMLARTAMLLGYLRLSANLSEQLPDLHLPAAPPHAVVTRQRLESRCDALLVRSIELLNQGDRIALNAERAASTILEMLIENTAKARRLQLSFTTGLNPSPERLFRVHLLPMVNSRIHSQLTALGIRFVASTA